MNDPNVQAGHTRAARHVRESGATDAAANDPATFMHLHSRRSFYGKVPDPAQPADPKAPRENMGLDVVIRENNGKLRIDTRHTAQEKLINEGVKDARRGSRLTPEGQAAAGDEVLWRTQGTGWDQREVIEKRASGMFNEAAAIEKGPAVKAYRARLAAKKAASGTAVPTGATQPKTTAPTSATQPKTTTPTSATQPKTTAPTSPTQPQDDRPHQREPVEDDRPHQPEPVEDEGTSRCSADATGVSKVRGGATTSHRQQHVTHRRTGWRRRLVHRWGHARQWGERPRTALKAAPTSGGTTTSGPLGASARVRSASKSPSARATTSPRARW